MDKILPRRASSLAVGIMLFLLEDNDDDEEEEEGEGPLPPGIEVKVKVTHAIGGRGVSSWPPYSAERKLFAQFLFIYFFSTRERPIE